MSVSTENILQEPFSVYTDYCIVKAHFTTKHYDIVKYKGKMRVSEKAFRERKDRPFFHYLSRVMSRKDNIPFFVSQFVENSNFWIGDMILEKDEAMARYTAWANRIEALKSNYVIDLRNIANKGYTWKTILGYRKPNHPDLFRMVVSKAITPETYVLIDKITNFISKTTEAYKDDSVYCQINLKFTKYRTFLVIPEKKILAMTPKELKSA